MCRGTSELRARSTLVQVPVAADVVVTPARERVHIMKSPYDGPPKTPEERTVVNEASHPVKIHDIGRRQLLQQYVAVLCAVIGERLARIGTRVAIFPKIVGNA